MMKIGTVHLKRQLNFYSVLVQKISAHGYHGTMSLDNDVHEIALLIVLY